MDNKTYEEGQRIKAKYEERAQRAEAVDMMKHIAAAWDVEPWEVFPYIPKRIRMGEPIKAVEEEPENER